MTTTFPQPKIIDTGELNMAIYQAGEGLPVIMCHGFPETAFSWRHQLGAVASAGFHAIAPDMRGYGKTGAPKKAKGDQSDVPLYDIEHLTGDLVSLLDKLSLEKAIFCGHDWGGLVVWQLPLFHPDRVAGVIGVNSPFIARPKMEPIGGLRHVFGDDNYIVMFQDYGKVDKLLEADIARSMSFWYRKGMTRAQYNSQPAERRGHSFIKAYESFIESGEAPDALVMSDTELAVYIKAFEKTGYTPGINWYRNLTRNWELSEGLEEKITCPCLMISAADDVVLTPEMTSGMENYISDLEKHIIPDCGHWTQQEKPGELNRLMTDWLKKRFA